MNTEIIGFTATASHEGVIRYSIIGGPSWCTLSDNNSLTVAPPSTVNDGVYTCTIKATEMYGDHDIYLPNNTPSKSIWGGGAILVSKYKKMQFLNQDTAEVIATIYVYTAVTPKP